MKQWLDDTLVATECTPGDKFTVLELPARQTKMITSRRTFKTLVGAEAHLLN